MDWYKFDDGVTIGQTGSERGIILVDEEHRLGSRITLEQGGETAPFSITCGIYGWMVHTVFFGDLLSAEGSYEHMKGELARILGMMASDQEGDIESIVAEISAFVDQANKGLL